MERQATKRQRLRKQRIQQNFMGSAGFFALTSLTVLLTPFTGDEGVKKIIGYLAGAIFWIGIVMGCILYFWLCKKERDLLNEKVPKGKLPRGLCFFGNPYAAVNDAVLIATLVLNIYCIRTLVVNRFLELSALFFFTTSVYMHFLLNGRVFQYMKLTPENGCPKKEKGVREK